MFDRVLNTSPDDDLIFKVLLKKKKCLYKVRSERSLTVNSVQKEDTKKELRTAVETLPKQLTASQEDVKGVDGVGRRYTK